MHSIAYVFSRGLPDKLTVHQIMAVFRGQKGMLKAVPVHRYQIGNIPF
jgi:DNA-binding cell septation regulator SpoVG